MTIDIEKYTYLPLSDMKLLFKDLKRRGLKINYILDIGAHSSQWSRVAMEIFPSSISYLIEPLSEMEENLKQFCKEYPGSKYFINGAGAMEDTKYLTVRDNLEGANFLLEKKNHLIDKNIQREVKIITIDSLIEKNEINIPELAKLDVQGYELEVLKGANSLFGKTEVFILEISLFEYTKGIPIFSEVINFMAQKGYEAYDFPRFSRRPYDFALGQLDVCFAKNKGFLRSSDLWT